MKIAIHINSFTLRGTEVAIFDYAEMLVLFGHEVLFFYPSNAYIEKNVFHRFSKLFSLYKYDSLNKIESYLNSNSFDLVYILKSGEKDELVFNSLPTAIHAVFPQSLYSLHGKIYTTISPWLCNRFFNNLIKSVPHIVKRLTPSIGEDEFRAKLGIKKNAFVVGGYGGETSFDITFVKQVVIPFLLKKRSDIYFVFMNFKKFINHERVIFLPGTNSIIDKSNYVASVDLMLHARSLGETFGLAIGEFTSLAKPILTYGNSPHAAHLDILGNNCLKYYNSNQLIDMLINLERCNLYKYIPPDYSMLYNVENVYNDFLNNIINPSLSNDQFNYDKINSLLKISSLMIYKKGLLHEFYTKRFIANQE